MAHYQMAVKGRVKRLKSVEGLSDEEMDWAIAEVERICELELPFADSTVIPIEATGGIWHRQKPEGAHFRTILSIRRETHQIVVQAILRRDDKTYRRVKLIFDASTDP